MQDYAFKTLIQEIFQKTCQWVNKSKNPAHFVYQGQLISYYLKVWDMCLGCVATWTWIIPAGW